MKDAGKESTTQLLRAVLALGRRLRTARAPGSRTLSGLGILGTLHRVGPLLATQLAAEEGLQPQSLTRLLAELETGKFISRKRSQTDGRAYTIELTTRGRRHLQDEIEERRSWLKDAVSSTLSASEREIALSAAAVLLKIATYQSTDGKRLNMPAQTNPGLSVVDKNLAGASYRNVKLEKAAFDDVNLKRSSFRNINFSEATFADINFTNASIDDARLDGMTINGVLVPELLRRHHGAESNAVFHVSNFAKSLDFYTRILGFEIDFKFGSPETYAGLCWKNVHLHISSSYPYKNNTGHGNLYVYCGEIDRLFEKLDSAGVEFYSRISDRAYGMRDFAIKDPDGNQIGYAASLDATRDRPADAR